MALMLVLGILTGEWVSVSRSWGSGILTIWCRPTISLAPKG